MEQEEREALENKMGDSDFWYSPYSIPQYDFLIQEGLITQKEADVHREGRAKMGLPMTFAELKVQPIKIGYARVSTDDQNLDLQRDALATAGCEQIYEETASGKNSDRPELEHCLKALRAGDTLIVWRLDRLGRSVPDLVRIVGDLEQRGIGFESLHEKIDTASATGKLVFHMFAALAEFERNLIRERTIAGLNAARARGRKGGRKPVLTDKAIKEIKALLRDPDVSVKDVCDRYGVSRSTIYNRIGAVQPNRTGASEEGREKTP